MKRDTAERNIGRAYVAWLGDPTKKKRAPLQAALDAYQKTLCQDANTASDPRPSEPLSKSTKPRTARRTKAPTSMAKPRLSARSRVASPESTQAKSETPCGEGSPADLPVTSALAPLAGGSTSR